MNDERPPQWVRIFQMITGLILGFITFVTGVVNFVKLLQGDTRLATIVLFIATVMVAITGCAYVAFKRVASPSAANKKIWRYPRGRPWAIAAMIVILIISIIVIIVHFRAAPPAPASPTPEIVCTPPPCASGEVLYCPGECPGGCGVVCATPTPGEEAGGTPSSLVTTEAGCTLDARWVADVTVPDSTEFAPGTPFVKTWRVRNSGTCNWDPGTQLVFVSGEPLGGPASVSVPAVAAGAQTDVSVNLTAPATPGTYRGNWQFQAPDGTRFGSVIYVQIVVPSPITPTPTPGLAILSFTVEVVRDLPPEGKLLRFSWQTTGATQAGIWSGTRMFPTYWEATPPGEGTLTVDVGMTYYRDPVMTLVARDGVGHAVQATAVVPWPCRYSYFFPTDTRTCPAYEASTTWAAEEPFQNGRMIWLQEVRTGSSVYQKTILVFYNDGRFEKYPDTFVEGEPESDPTIVPPAGLYQPIRGFGKLWRTNSSVRDRLGWATAPEQGFNTQWQMQIAESIGITFFVQRINGRVIQAAGWDTGSGTWREVP